MKMNPAKLYNELVALLFYGEKDKNSEQIYLADKGLNARLGDFGEGFNYSDKAERMHEHAWN